MSVGRRARLAPGSAPSDDRNRDRARPQRVCHSLAVQADADPVTRSAPEARLSDEGGPVWLFAGVAVAAFCAVLLLRLRFLDLPLERDEGAHAVIAQQMLAGLPPYANFHDMRFPGIYVAYAAAMGIFGATHTGIHAALLAVNAISCALLFALGRSLAGVRIGLAAAAAFAVLSIAPVFQGLWANNEHFVLPPALAGLWLLLAALEAGGPARFFAAGVLLGAAAVVKQHGLFFPLFGFALALTHARSQRGVRGPGAGRSLAALGLGIAVPFAGMGLALGAAGVLGDFWFWTVRYSWQYASRLSLAEGLGNLAAISGALVGPAWLLLGLAIVGLAGVAFGSRWHHQRPFVVGFVVASALCVVPGLYFRGHYFALLLPAVALAAAFGIEAAARRAAPVHPLAASLVAACLLAGGLASPLIADRAFYSLNVRDATRAVYFANPFPEAPEIGAFIRERSTPDDSIAVVGSEAEIYFYAARRPATAYLYTYPLMEPQPLASAMQREMIEQIETAQPAFIVFVGTPYSWLKRDDSPQLIFQWVKRYTERDYERVGVVDVISPYETVSRWGEEAAHYSPISQNWVWVFQRRVGGRSNAPEPGNPTLESASSES
jgi:4-amino-4-deoxy-L-arabinose transferase-like glycosyltransferase